MNRKLISVFAVALVAASLMSSVAHASPFYYYFAEDAPTNAASGQAQTMSETVQDAAGQVQQAAGQAAGQAQDAMKDAAQQVTSSATGSESPIRERITGHMSDLYSHGSSAMKGLVENVKPDMQNIGKDLTDAYQQTRTEVGRRIEPITHTVKPYIDHAQKAVAPYVNKAREEVPKVMNKVGSAVWSKIGGSGSPSSQEASVEQVSHATNAVQKEAEKVAQEGADAAKQQ